MHMRTKRLKSRRPPHLPVQTRPYRAMLESTRRTRPPRAATSTAARTPTPPRLRTTGTAQSQGETRVRTAPPRKREAPSCRSSKRAMRRQLQPPLPGRWSLKGSPVQRGRVIQKTTTHPASVSAPSGSYEDSANSPATSWTLPFTPIAGTTPSVAGTGVPSFRRFRPGPF